MNNSLTKILYGYVFIFLSIRIGIDILADPIGYFLIAVGCYKIGEHFMDGKIAAYLAFGLLFLSFPTVFIDLNLVESGPWFYYGNVLFTGEIVLTFYLFRMLLSIAESNRNSPLKERTQRLFNFYMPANLLLLALTAILIVFEIESIQFLAIVLLLILLGLNIALLFLVNAFRKAVRDEEPPSIAFKESGGEI